MNDYKITGRKKLAIVAFAPSSAGLAPYNNDEYDIWILNHYYSVMNIDNINNISMLFEPHTRAVVSDKSRYNGVDHLKWLQENKKLPIMMMTDVDQQEWKDVPMAVSYPWQEVIKHFKLNDRPDCEDFRYFTNTISFMIAHAIYGKTVGLNQYDDIEIYGVDMALASEYAYERPSCEFFIGWARAKGFNVYIPKESDILKTATVYGREEYIGEYKRYKDMKRVEELKQRIARAKEQEIANIETYYQQREETLANYHKASVTTIANRSKLEGALENQQYEMEVWR